MTDRDRRPRRREQGPRAVPPDAGGTTGTRSPRTLLVLVFLLAVVSIAGGLVGVALGPPPGDSAAATGVAADSEYRFLSGTWLCCGVLALWSLRRPAERAHVTQAFLAVALVGGLGRLVSLLSSGSPGPLFVSALTVELVVVPLVLVWHRRHYRGPSRQRT